jgi:hypothetical protein
MYVFWYLENLYNIFYLKSALMFKYKSSYKQTISHSTNNNAEDTDIHNS